FTISDALVTIPRRWASKTPSLMPSVRPRSSALTMSCFGAVTNRSLQEVQREGHRAAGRLHGQQRGTRGRQVEVPGQRLGQGGDGLEDAAGQDHRKGLAPEVDLPVHRAGAVDELRQCRDAVRGQALNVNAWYTVWARVYYTRQQ